MFHFAVMMLRVLEVLFFVGLAGCTLAVFLSWVSIVSAVIKRGE